MPRRKARPRSGGRLLKQKAARARRKKKSSGRRVVYRDKAGRFAARSARSRQGVQLLGKRGVYAPPLRRTREAATAALAELLGGPSTYSSRTQKGTMAERFLSAVSSTGEPLAVAFSRKKQSGVATVTAGDGLSFVTFFSGLDLQEVLAAVLAEYFRNAHASRERVSAKALIGKGPKAQQRAATHREYELVRTVDVVVRLG